MRVPLLLVDEGVLVCRDRIHICVSLRFDLRYSGLELASVGCVKLIRRIRLSTRTIASVYVQDSRAAHLGLPRGSVFIL